jgi:hypothetical protein
MRIHVLQLKLLHYLVSLALIVTCNTYVPLDSPMWLMLVS